MRTNKVPARYIITGGDFVCLEFINAELSFIKHFQKGGVSYE